MGHYEALWNELTEAQTIAMRFHTWHIVEHLNKERNRIWYQYLIPDELYKTLPPELKTRYPR